MTVLGALAVCKHNDVIRELPSTTAHTHTHTHCITRSPKMAVTAVNRIAVLALQFSHPNRRSDVDNIIHHGRQAGRGRRSQTRTGSS
jgi:hypothetical protein